MSRICEDEKLGDEPRGTTEQSNFAGSILTGSLQPLFQVAPAISRRSNPVGSSVAPSRDISAEELTERSRKLLWDSVAKHFRRGADGAVPSAPLWLRRETFPQRSRRSGPVG